MAKYLKQTAGKLQEASTGGTGGAVDANKIPHLNGAGQLTEAMLPPGTGRDVVTLNASEQLAAGAVVNIHKDGSDFKVRNADASSGKPCHGFVLKAVNSGAAAEIHRDGSNSGVNGLTDVDVFLSTTAGRVTSTAPTGSGQIAQRLGAAVSDTTFNFEAGTPITLA